MQPPVRLMKMDGANNNPNGKCDPGKMGQQLQCPAAARLDGEEEDGQGGLPTQHGIESP